MIRDVAMHETRSDPATPDRPYVVGVIGWTFLVLAILRIIQTVLFYAFWKFAGLERGLPTFLPWRLPAGPYDVNAVVKNLGPAILVQGLIALAVGYAAWNLLRLRSWARLAIEIVCWAGAVLWVFIALTLIASVAFPRMKPFVSPGGSSDEFRLVGAALSGALVVILVRCILALRRSEIRRAFA
jgi:hypothetical protein